METEAERLRAALEEHLAARERTHRLDGCAKCEELHRAIYEAERKARTAPAEEPPK